MLIAQISDLHLRPRGMPAIRLVETNMLVARAITALMALDPRPDVVLVTGDVVNIGTPDEYETAHELLSRLPMPVYAVPGNHDHRENFRKSLQRFPGVTSHPRFVQYAIEDFPLRLVALDTHIPRSSAGEMCEERLVWLDKTLAAEPGKPTFIFAHHPPFLCGIGHMDKIRLIEGGERLESIVRANPQVKALAFGHHHRPIETVFGGALASIAPGVAHQVELDLREGEPEGLLNMEPAAYRLWRWDGERLVSHMAYVERFPGPFPFVED
ncbi:MAG: phosphodiesterase [Hyphomicrobiales bacterium]|nr:phosphodiesterase [Hyphomicrobiales bacterium]MBV9589152.1 phosphodiesterase [Hyphomicrobiales bacterium]MBV9752025.1 phosphodiesterase [Hyphomicrobiales bacterium]